MEKVYRIEPDGEVSSVKIASFSDLNPQFAYVLVTERHARKIYVWKGQGSSVRMKFMAARYALNLRMEVGMVYRTVNIDQGYEDDDFLAHIGGRAIAMEKSYGLDALDASEQTRSPQTIQTHFQARKSPIASSTQRPRVAAQVSSYSTKSTTQTSPKSTASTLPLPSLTSTPSPSKEAQVRQWETKEKQGILKMEDISAETIGGSPSAPVVTLSTQQVKAKEVERPSVAYDFAEILESEFHTLNRFFNNEWPEFSFEEIGRNSTPDEWFKRSAIILQEKGLILGCVNCHITGGILIIETLIIKHDSEQKESIKDSLLNQVEKYAKGKNCHKLVSMVNVQSPLGDFLQKKGWLIETTFTNDFFGMTWQRMTKYLS